MKKRESEKKNKRERHSESKRRRGEERDGEQENYLNEIYKHKGPYLTLYDLWGKTSFNEKNVSLLCNHSYKIWLSLNVKC